MTYPIHTAPKVASPLTPPNGALNHAEAYCLMCYESADGRTREYLWNSRDGVTPLVIETVDRSMRMQHIEHSRDQFCPDHVPAIGDRVFVDATPEIMRPWAEENFEKLRDNPEFVAMFSRERAFAVKRIIERNFKPGQPWVIVVDETWLAELAKKREVSRG